MKRETSDRRGVINGWIMPIWNSRESEYRPDQVYVIGIDYEMSKGPHLHKRRAGYFACIHGEVSIITREDDQYRHHVLNQMNAHQPLYVAPGVPCEIVNIGDDSAWVINMPSPSWSLEEPDEWPVENWNPPPFCEVSDATT